MLVNSIALLNESRASQKCIAAFNTYNLETVQAALKASAKAQVPVIIAFGEGYLKHMPLKAVVALVKALAEHHPQTVVLHLDHAKEMETVIAAIEAGFTSVMYDGSHLSLEENIKNTASIVSLAHAKGVSVEGELGGMNPEDGSEVEEPSHFAFTDPDQALQFVTETGVDSLAIVIGNAHGLYKGTPMLDIERLEAIERIVKIPLVLHGSSGLSEEQLQTAIAHGVAKINVNTEIAMTGAKSIREMLETSPNNMRLEKLMLHAEEAMAVAMQAFLKYAR